MEVSGEQWTPNSDGGKHLTCNCDGDEQSTQHPDGAEQLTSNSDSLRWVVNTHLWLRRAFNTQFWLRLAVNTQFWSRRVVNMKYWWRWAVNTPFWWIGAESGWHATLLGFSGQHVIAPLSDFLGRPPDMGDNHCRTAELNNYNSSNFKHLMQAKPKRYLTFPQIVVLAWKLWVRRWCSSELHVNC